MADYYLCDNCEVEVNEDDIICTECGFNLHTGKVVQRETGADILRGDWNKVLGFAILGIAMIGGGLAYYFWLKSGDSVEMRQARKASRLLLALGIGGLSCIVKSVVNLPLSWAASSTFFGVMDKINKSFKYLFFGAVLFLLFTIGSFFYGAKEAGERLSEIKLEVFYEKKTKVMIANTKKEFLYNLIYHEKWEEAEKIISRVIFEVNIFMEKEKDFFKITTKVWLKNKLLKKFVENHQFSVGKGQTSTGIIIENNLGLSPKMCDEILDLVLKNGKKP